jgi:hypothetical protein
MPLPSDRSTSLTAPHTCSGDKWKPPGQAEFDLVAQSEICDGHFDALMSAKKAGDEVATESAERDWGTALRKLKELNDEFPPLCEGCLVSQVEIDKCVRS